MAANISQIGDAIGNISYNFSNLNVTDILPNAIATSNSDSNGYVGLIVFIILCFSMALFIYKNRAQFGFFDEFTMFFASLGVAIDIGIYLLIWRILESYVIFWDLVVIYFVLCAIALIKKDLEDPEK